MNAKNAHRGSTFDSFLRGEGILEQTEAVAIKRVIAHQIEEAMRYRNLTKTMMAKKMHTSRSAVERLFDPGNDSATLSTLNKAAALGKSSKSNSSERCG